MNLNKGEKIVLHRGLSTPLCPHSEVTRLTAKQARDGIKRCLAGLVYAVQDENELVDLRFYGATSLEVKQVGESNALVPAELDSPFTDYWSHVVSLGRLNFAMLGRPNRRRLGPQYDVPFSHQTSTRLWKSALGQLPGKVGEFAPQISELLYPHLSACFDLTRSQIDQTFLTSV